MPKPRVFISHSAKEPDTGAFLFELRDALSREVNGEHQFEVLLDKDGLQLGDYWRSTLNLWIGGCDAAIVLLSPSALKSTFVAYEASILSYRKTVDPNFRLFPVLIKPVRHEDVIESPLKPSQITEIQDVTVIDNNTSVAAIEAILDGLAGLNRYKTPAERHATELAKILQKLDKEDLEFEAARLDIDLSTWIPNEDLALTLALKLIGAGLTKASPTIKALRARFIPLRRRELTQLMIDLVASSWVDYKAAAILPKVARARKRQCVAVPACKELTATMYVIVAGLLDSNRLPIDPWLAPGVPAIVGEVINPQKAPPELIVSIEKALRTSLKVGKSQDFKKALKNQTDHEPVFLALPSNPGIPAKWLEDLQENFPGVTFFLLLGEHELKEQNVHNENIVLLDPCLTKECEEIFCTTYEEETEYLTRGLSNE